MDWSDARAVITGGASGLGRAVAQEILMAIVNDRQLAE